MSQELISHSEDLKRLVDEGYEIEIRAGHLILHRVPYVTSERAVKYGQLVCTLAVNGSQTGAPPDHTMYFAGEYPCDDKGMPIEALRNSSNRQELAEGLWVDHYFSAKPPTGNYRDYHQKVTHYAQVIGRCARRIDPGAIGRAGRLELSPDQNDPFVFMETASSRAGITRMNESLAGDRIGIVGLGGTGSYILDYASKTRVSEIHLFDGDVYQQHNAFRAPGATGLEELERRVSKVALYAERYSKMRSGIVAHEADVTPANIEMLGDLDFVFVAVDDNATRHWLLPALEEAGVPFVDVGMGIEKVENKLLGVVRTSYCETPSSSSHERGDAQVRDVGEYERNVQIVELNALNAALAVIRWKKHRGFYLDLGGEDRSTYTIDGNHMVNRRSKAGRRAMKLAHEFVDSIPEELEDGVLYVSIRFGTVVHKCACGCGEEVVTPLGPAEWRLTYDGKTVSLAPSIGKLEFRLQIALLDRRRPGPVGSRLFGSRGGARSTDGKDAAGNVLSWGRCGHA